MDGVEWHYDDVLILIGFGKGHLLVMIVSGLLVMYTSNETMGMSIIVPASECLYDTGVYFNAIAEAAGFSGMLLSSIVWGYYADEIGRRTVLLRSVGFSLIFSWCSMLVTNYWLFVLLRFCTGLCVAGPGFAAITYLAEFCSSKYRASILNFMFMFMGLSCVYCPGTAHFIKDLTFRIPIMGNLIFVWWRLVGLLLSVPGLISFLILLKLPESPKFLIAMQRYDEAYDAVAWLCLLNTGKQLEDDLNVERIAAFRYTKTSFFIPKNFIESIAHDVIPLFRKPFVKNFIISSIIMFGLLVISNGVGIWFTDMRSRVSEYYRHLNRTGIPVTVCEMMESYQEIKQKQRLAHGECVDRRYGYVSSVVLGCSFILSCNLFGSLLLFVKRKPIFITALSMSGCCGMALIFANQPMFMRIAIVFFIAFPSVIFVTLSGAVLEFIPTTLRGKAMCICLVIGRMGSVTGTFVMANFVEGACRSTLAFISTFPLIAAVMGYFLPLDAHLY